MAERDNSFGLTGLLRGLGDLLHQAADHAADRRAGPEGTRPVVESRMTIRSANGDEIGADFFGFGPTAAKPDAEPPPPPPPDRREPLVDIIAAADAISAIVELPGADAQTLVIRVEHDMLTIAAAGHGIEYAAEALLPAPVADGAREQSFRNGVLELKWPRADTPA